MNIRKFDLKKDLINLENFLRNQYLFHEKLESWLPQRLHDMIYRMSAIEERNNREKSRDFIYLVENNDQIVACILPDGENIYFSIDEDYKYIFKDLLSFGEINCLPLFDKMPNGDTKFWVAINESNDYMINHLIEQGYEKYHDKDYNNYIYPMDVECTINIPDGFKLLYGNEYTDEIKKCSACHLGFHPEDENNDYLLNMNSYNIRKESSMYIDSFECLIIDENSIEDNNICAYCFVYIDKQTSSAFIEPVCTREKYRRKGFGKALMNGVIIRCKEKNIQKCYVNSFGWRKKFYNSVKFITESEISFWHKVIK